MCCLLYSHNQTAFCPKDASNQGWPLWLTSRTVSTDWSPLILHEPRWDFSQCLHIKCTTCLRHQAQQRVLLLKSPVVYVAFWLFFLAAADGQQQRGWALVPSLRQREGCHLLRHSHSLLHPTGFSHKPLSRVPNWKAHKTKSMNLMKLIKRHLRKSCICSNYHVIPFAVC